MARFRLSFNEGSLLRRTLLHVGAFVLGTAAFLAIASFALVSIMKSALSPADASSRDGEDASEEATTTATTKAAPTKPPRRKKRPAAAAPTPQPNAADDE